MRRNGRGHVPIAALLTWIASKAGKFTIGLVLLALAVVLPLLRQTGARSWQTIGSEDQSIYFEQAKLHGSVAVLFRGYNGYLQFPPRVLGAFSPLLPIRDLRIYFAISSVVVCALLAWFTYHYCEGWIASQTREAGTGLSCRADAHARLKTPANITNTIWVSRWLRLWALVSLHERRRDVVMRSGVGFFAAASTVLSLFFLPLAVGYALYSESGNLGLSRRSSVWDSYSRL